MMSDIKNVIDLPLDEFIQTQKKLHREELRLLVGDDGEMMTYVELMWTAKWYRHQAKKVEEMKQVIADLMPILRDWEPDHSSGEERQKWARAQALISV